MNTMNYKLLAFIITTSLLGTSCSDEDALNPNAGSSNANSGTISHKNFRLGSDLNPAVDNGDGTLNFVEQDVSINIGDRNNQVLTDSHTIFFATEWGLIEPSCVTVDGSCSVKWQTSDGASFPGNDTAGRTAGSPGNTIVAYTTGEEAFTDLNDSGDYDDADGGFTDLDEPYIDINNDGVHDALIDPIIDTANGNDNTGNNGVHDIADGFFNGPGCAHTVNCSTFKNATIWTSLTLKLDGSTAPVFPIGGTLAGYVGPGNVVLQNNGGDDLTLNANGGFTFATDASAYAVTVFSSPVGETCLVTSGGTGTATALVNDVIVDCAATATFNIGGTMTGLVGTIVLQNNLGDDLTIIATNGPFVFATPIFDGTNYDVTILTQPITGETCSVVGVTGSGTVAGSNITTVSVDCI